MGALLIGCVMLYYAQDLIDALNNIADAIRGEDEE
jgi:hypothetical protein